jgi:hypothetical protein
MTRRSVTRHAVLLAVSAVLACSIGLLVNLGTAHGDTSAGTLSGEGGDALGPVLQTLINADASQLNPDTGSYLNVDLDQAISDFIGTAPGSFGADFIVSERPLTSTETATATTNGRSFAYVPFAATPVALMTLVPNSTFSGLTIAPDQYCQHIQLTLDDLDGIYGIVSPTYANWADSRINCTTGPNTQANASPFGLWANADPTMENSALMSLLDSTPTSKAAFQAGLSSAFALHQASTSDPTASETWPYTGTAFPGGDEVTLGKLIGLNAKSEQPSTITAQVALGAIMPVASDWTGDPLGVPWNLPTAAVQNAQGAFVVPSTAAAEAAENDAALASTSDPTTNNLVTFQASSTDASAYNNFLMLQSYLVVPTNGLSSDKAQALAQFIRFALGTQGQKDIAALGAAPATPAMVTAGLQVAQQLNIEAATQATSTSSSCSTTTTTVSDPSTTTTAPNSSTTPTAPSTTTTTCPTTTTTECSSPTTTTTAPKSTTSTTSSTTTTTAPSSTTTSTSTPSTSTTTTTAPGGTTTTSTPSSSTTTTAPGGTTTTSTPLGSTTTTQACPTSTTTTSGGTTTTALPACTTASTTTSTTAPPTSTSTTPPSTSTSTTTGSTSTTTSSPSTTTTTSPDASTTTTTAPDSTTTTTPDASTTTTSTGSTTTTDPTTTTTAPTTTTTTAPTTTTTTAPTTTTTTPSTSTTTTSPGASTTTTAPTTTTTSSNTTTTTTCTTTTTGAVTTGPGSDSGDGSGALAFTGLSPVPLLSLGLGLFVVGELGMRRFRKRATAS